MRAVAREEPRVERRAALARSRRRVAYALALVWVVVAAALYAVEALRLAGGLG